MKKNVLTLTVSKQWFDMIVNCFERVFRCLYLYVLKTK